MKELLYLKDDQLKGLIEKLFVSYRETFSDSKKILDKYSIGVATPIEYLSKIFLESENVSL